MKLTILLLAACAAWAESGYDAWLRYVPARRPVTGPAVLSVIGDSPVLASAADELTLGFRGFYGQILRRQKGIAQEPSLLIGTIANLRAAAPGAPLPASLAPEGFYLGKAVIGGVTHQVIAGADERGVLYGAFALLRQIASNGAGAELISTPYAPVRWVNQWDNLDGTIERGYGGRSIFWDANNVRADLSRVRDYARLLTSLGINACGINNVNANPLVLQPAMLAQAARIADVMRPWGVRLILSVDFGSPSRAGGLKSFDPLLPEVAQWWKDKVDEVYRAIPDLAGFVMKADSEGRVGPSSYGRTHADAANTVARALRPHGGLMFYRAFVYNHNLDWRNAKNDRARAAYDNFQPLDGKFDENVVIQIKNGPIDFQVREPASPLFAALERTNQAIELQVTQEYFGQARHNVYLAPYWKDTLDTDLFARGAGTPVKALIAGKTFQRPVGGFVGVANVGLDDNWTGNHLSQANLYAYGRLAWNPNLSSEEILREWMLQTFSASAEDLKPLAAMQMESWRTYENYTGPLGLQTLTAITGTHFGPAVEASERNGWGQWHRSDEKGAGMDRTAATGTGFIAQFRGPLAKKYESLSTCPDDLLLFMHHVPYTHVLHSGKTVIQTIYNLHYDGAAKAESFVQAWKKLRSHVDERRYLEVLAQLNYQAGHAELWRDAVVSWFHKTSGIADEKGRAGSYPGRIEAESMELTGYVTRKITPWEAASGSTAIECSTAPCRAAYRFQGAPGWYNVKVRYFDMPNAVSRFRLLAGDQVLDEWAADDRLPARDLDSSSSTRRIVTGVALRLGDEIRIEGTPEGKEAAALDYIEIRRENN